MRANDAVMDLKFCTCARVKLVTLERLVVLQTPKKKSNKNKTTTKYKTKIYIHVYKQNNCLRNGFILPIKIKLIKTRNKTIDD